VGKIEQMQNAQETASLPTLQDYFDNCDRFFNPQYLPIQEHQDRQQQYVRD